MSTTFINQGCGMDLRFGGSTVPIASINLFDTLIILILIPLLDSIIFPLLERMGVKLTTLRKIGFGFAVATSSMLMSAMVEYYRLSLSADGQYVGVSVCNNVNDIVMNDDGTAASTPAQAVALSIFWQIPQYVLVGTSEVLASAVSTEFFYTQAPASMKSVCAALSLLTTAFGAWLSAALVPLVNISPSSMWITPDVNQGHLDYYFLLLAGLMALNTIVFVREATKYEYKLIEIDVTGGSRVSSSTHKPA